MAYRKDVILGELRDIGVESTCGAGFPRATAAFRFTTCGV